MNDDEKYMKLALDCSLKAYQIDEVPVGAIIVSNGKIIAKCWNKKENYKDATMHAELLAIKKACKKLNSWRLNNCTMYITLFPCPMCASAIVQARIKKIVIGAPTKDLKNEQIVNMIFEDSIKKNNLTLTKYVLEDKCTKILKDFFKHKRLKNK